jgi:hypothetical protein
VRPDRYGSTLRLINMEHVKFITIAGMNAEPFIFRCPITDQNVQFRLEADDARETEFEGVTCPACTRLHVINRKTGKLLGASSKIRPI